MISVVVAKKSLSSLFSIISLQQSIDPIIKAEPFNGN